jgi:hypothetical protein
MDDHQFDLTLGLRAQRDRLLAKIADESGLHDFGSTDFLGGLEAPARVPATTDQGPVDHYGHRAQRYHRAAQS